MAELDFSRHYTVRGNEGVAWRLLRYCAQWTEEEWAISCDNDEHEDYPDHYGNVEDIRHPECWLYTEPEEIEDTSFVIGVMVGDDRETMIDVDDLKLIEETGFCRDCGQVGCTSNVYE